MNFLTQAFVLTVFIFTITNAANPEESKNTCLKTLSITPEEFEEAKKAKFQNASDKIKCFFDCFGKEMKFGTNAALNVDEIVKYHLTLKPGSTADEIKTVINGCKDKATGANDCEKAYTFTGCLYQGMKI